MRTPILACTLASCVLASCVLASCVLVSCVLVSCAVTEGSSTPAAGWQPLFDGETLDGWVEAGGRYDGAARWTVEDGCITGREGPNRAGGLIYTANYYRNFVFKCDVWMSYPFDSGIFVRMVPRPGDGPGDKGAQVTLDHRPAGEIAGIYSDGWLLHNQGIQAKYKRNQWNHFEVRCRGSEMHIEVWMNGDKVTDYRLPKGRKGYAPAGRIGLQVHGDRADPEGSRVQFKGLYIRELPEYDAAVFECDDHGFLHPTAAATKAGWKPLFNGKDLSGWEPAGGKTGFAVRDGMIEVL
ncbi:MAG: 3-keto-disaccharide hydrolase, partial [Planctomycetota bacterium]